MGFLRIVTAIVFIFLVVVAGLIIYEDSTIRVDATPIGYTATILGNGIVEEYMIIGVTILNGPLGQSGNYTITLGGESYGTNTSSFSVPPNGKLTEEIWVKIDQTPTGGITVTSIKVQAQGLYSWRYSRVSQVDLQINYPPVSWYLINGSTGISLVSISVSTVLNKTYASALVKTVNSLPPGKYDVSALSNGRVVYDTLQVLNQSSPLALSIGIPLNTTVLTLVMKGPTTYTENYGINDLSYYNPMSTSYG